MNQTKKQHISRRQFARRAAVLSATASLAPAAAVIADAAMPAGSQEPPDSHPHLSPESVTEAEARYQQILSQYADRFTAEEKASVKKMNLDLQTSLDRVRAFSLQNGDAPALYLRPLLEREKKKSETPASAAAKKS
jgi:hypothetical protein